MRQNRQCTNGTYEKCSAADSERTIPCKLQDCEKILQDWTNSSNCQAAGENRTCGASGHRLQFRDCLDGTSDRCTSMETTRMVACRIANNCSGKYCCVVY